MLGPALSAGPLVGVPRMTGMSAEAAADPTPYDALLVVSFGGPEKPEDVVPFLENVTRGRGIPKERLEEVGEHSTIRSEHWIAILGCLHAP